MSRSDAPVHHHFTVDVEEYFQPSALEPFIPRDAWPELERRSPAVLERLLQLLGTQGIRGTFFVVGWLAEREPAMIRELARAGHEIGSHSWDHRRITTQTPEAFRESVRRSKALLEDLTGQSVTGFRAPSWSIVPGVEWALDVLLEEGYRYDSSLFPIRHHPDYGYPGADRDPHWLERPRGSIAEIPPATLRRFGSNFPAAGGAYFRFGPYALLRWAFREAEARGQPATFYVHPWELDTFVPEVAMSRLARLRTFGGARRTWPRIERLLSEFRFGRMDATVRRMAGGMEVG